MKKKEYALNMEHTHPIKKWKGMENKVPKLKLIKYAQSLKIT